MKKNELSNQSAIVLFSGGQDSATCLAWALDKFEHVETIGFHYGQSHEIEMTVRDAVREQISKLQAHWQSRLGEDYVYDAGAIGAISQSRLTGSTEALLRNEHLPETFVPGRNLVFLTLAAALAYRRGSKHLVTGVCETDFSGYPDCRDDTIKALQVAVNLGTEANFVIHTPLMWVDKAETWALADKLGGQALVQVIVRDTHTCYRGDRTHFHEWGYGCGECPACQLRANGWMRYSDQDRQVA